MSYVYLSDLRRLERRGLSDASTDTWVILPTPGPPGYVVAQDETTGGTQLVPTNPAYTPGTAWSGNDLGIQSVAAPPAPAPSAAPSGGWTADHQNAQGQWVNTSGQTFAQFQSGTTPSPSSPSSSSSNWGADITKLVSTIIPSAAQVGTAYMTTEAQRQAQAQQQKASLFSRLFSRPLTPVTPGNRIPRETGMAPGTVIGLGIAAVALTTAAVLALRQRHHKKKDEDQDDED